MSSLYQNAAVFVNHSRRHKSVNVDVDGDQLIVRNIVNGAPITSYTIVDTAKNDGSTGAFDAVENGSPDGTQQKIVVQLGCGCSGMRPWTPDPEYIERQKALAAGTA